VSVALSDFARQLSVETAFSVLAIAKSLKAAGKDVVELEIGDSPFESTHSAKAAGVSAIEQNQSHYCPSPGLPAFREGAARFLKREFGIPAEAKHIIVAPGAKVFEQFFCEAFLNPGDGVLVFSPYFPTYIPNIQRRGSLTVRAARMREASVRTSTESCTQLHFGLWRFSAATFGAGCRCVLDWNSSGACRASW
jgi:aspartate aminotransferase